MNTIKLNNKSIELIEGWHEITLGKYIDIIKLHNIKDTLIEEEFLLKLLSIISSLTEEEANNLYPEDMKIFEKYIVKNKFSLANFEKQKCLDFNFNSTPYTTVLPKKLTMGELISIKLLEKNSVDLLDSWLNLISILVRPATVSTDEFGEEIRTPNKFEGNEDLLIKRKEMFKNIPAVNALWIIEAFQSGKE